MFARQLSPQDSDGDSPCFSGLKLATLKIDSYSYNTNCGAYPPFSSKIPGAGEMMLRLLEGSPNLRFGGV